MESNNCTNLYTMALNSKNRQIMLVENWIYTYKIILFREHHHTSKLKYDFYSTAQWNKYLKQDTPFEIFILKSRGRVLQNFS